MCLFQPGNNFNNRITKMKGHADPHILLWEMLQLVKLFWEFAQTEILSGHESLSNRNWLNVIIVCGIY